MPLQHKTIGFEFHNNTPGAKNTGMKFVLFEITTDEGKILHDWGFIEWTGKAWGDIELPPAYGCKVVWWANTLQPSVLLNEPSKIISLNGKH